MFECLLNVTRVSVCGHVTLWIQQCTSYSAFFQIPSLLTILPQGWDACWWRRPRLLEGTRRTPPIRRLRAELHRLCDWLCCLHRPTTQILHRWQCQWHWQWHWQLQGHTDNSQCIPHSPANICSFDWPVCVCFGLKGQTVTELKFKLVAARIPIRRDSIPCDMYYRALQNALELFYRCIV